ncbi:MAG: hypothetical protein ACTJE9_04205 [Lactococcus lactis]
MMEKEQQLTKALLALQRVQHYLDEFNSGLFYEKETYELHKDLEKIISETNKIEFALDLYKNWDL